MADIRIREIQDTITGLELKNSNNESWFPLDMEETGLTYRINRDELIDFIIRRGTSQNILGTSIYKDTGNDADEIPYFITNNTGYGIVIHTSLGGLIVDAQKSAFNKDFSSAGGINGSSIKVAREDHTHSELSSISLVNNTHTATFYVTGETSYTITKTMLLSQMKYTPTKYINPTINYMIHLVNSNELTPLSTSDLTAVINQETAFTATTYVLKEFVSLALTGLTTTKKYAINIIFTDNGGMSIPIDGGSGS